MKMCFVSEMLG